MGGHDAGPPVRANRTGRQGNRPHRHRRPDCDRMHARRAGASHPVSAVQYRRLSPPAGRHQTGTAGHHHRRHPWSGPAVSDSYYELLDDGDADGERFAATDLVRSTWSAAIQHGAPVSALLVRALERCETRDDTRLSRVLVDLLGPVPVEGDLWVRAKRERSGKQIELISAEMLGPGPDGRPR